MCSHAGCEHLDWVVEMPDDIGRFFIENSRAGVYEIPNPYQPPQEIIEHVGAPHRAIKFNGQIYSTNECGLIEIEPQLLLEATYSPPPHGTAFEIIGTKKD